MMKRNNNTEENIEKAQPEKVVDDEVKITVAFFTDVLEKQNDTVVDNHEDQDRYFICKRFIACKDISSINSTVASHGFPRQTHPIDKPL